MTTSVIPILLSFWSLIIFPQVADRGLQELFDTSLVHILLISPLVN